ncbi:hypothetical protein H8R29_27785 (plasmid) [Priestia megaterium]|uniref:Replication-relaxation family protein n=1 Tax=Priestia megaterium (strain ATCC 14581 / DSM 32 / CCUG 1817 / JCM 2506 / NBRC 15308 / NCIMB 9376 / NCTC 10342 / NRRL B-14308 / VKM B-512 / Ford 19) TaxID=1348623 RepID=A0A0B6B0L3_PRIM2|nr:hypothetical protein [Priestia megaterium]AJI25714.1 replication-relaxation family protein [Priestia megaterium NBRC 15308 = ATCC 14581]KFN07605.1 replication-relaxation family protein [Priestia megaterium]KGJ74435.1 hypothetical protein BMT_03805 [Priestia megaterium NBRC 15308 = ATCC 14581]MDR4234874.1 hypothetical protein [Priestia megaterium]MED3805049.1 hypothetical protein [Priestia megaterium]
MSFRLSQRDKDIMAFINQFRAVDRDSLVHLFFKQLKSPVNACNSVMVRLYRLGLIERTQQYSPTVYLPVDAKIKKNSRKILHFLSILEIYKQMSTYGIPKQVIVEDKPTGRKGGIEPDLFCIFKGSPFWIEIQRNQYSEQKMQDKIHLYEEFFFSDEWKALQWQPEDRAAIFPSVILITPIRYAVSSDYFRLIQVASIHELMEKYKSVGKQQRDGKPRASASSGGIKINLT